MNGNELVNFLLSYHFRMNLRVFPFAYSLILVIYLIFSLETTFGFTVIIDPGHGGEDKGATQGTIRESEIALNVALKLATQFNNDPSIKVILTRPTDSSLSLKNRVEVNDLNNGDLFISLHVNSSTDKRAKGADFYIGNSISSQQTYDNNLKSAKTTVDFIVQNVSQTAQLYQSQFLASDTYETWKTSSVTLPRSIKQGPFFVINKNKVPSILVEFGFITNTKEALELIKEENQSAIAKSLYQAVKNFQNRKIN